MPHNRRIWGCVARGVSGIWSATVCETWFGQVKSGMKQRSSKDNPIVSGREVVEKRKRLKSKIKLVFWAKCLYLFPWVGRWCGGWPRCVVKPTRVIGHANWCVQECVSEDPRKRFCLWRAWFIKAWISWAPEIHGEHFRRRRWITQGNSWQAQRDLSHN